MNFLTTYYRSSRRDPPLIASSKATAALTALLVGGVIGGAAAFGPLYAVVGLAAVALGYAILTSTTMGIITVFGIATLLPFGTLPFKAVITPTLLFLALAALFGVWILRHLAHSETYDLRLTPLGIPILGFLGFTLFSLVLGAHGLPNTGTLHNYLKFVLGVLFFFSLANCIRTDEQARFAIRGLIFAGGVSALIGLFLYALNDETALRLLIILGRVGYPTSGRVLRYVEDDPDGLERAIGTSVDPNSYGGMLALIIGIAATQLFTSRPVIRKDLLTAIVCVMMVALLLTFSRAALIGVVAGAMYLATVRYRRLWLAMIGAGGILVGVLISLGITEEVVQRFREGIQFQDQAQQMRLAEYQNALAIIKRYPIFGIGFGQAPEIDLVAGVSSIYLTIAERMGLVGLAAFLAIVGAWFLHSFQALSTLTEERSAWLLGTQAGLVAALAIGLVDHYFFNIEFSHMVVLFWGAMGIGSATQLLPPSPHTTEAHTVGANT
jgi:O-antigen ligase